MSALAEALVAAQAELPCVLGKDADGQIQNRTYRYLTLDKLIAETRPILTKHGLSIVQWPSHIERGTEGSIPALLTMLSHVNIVPLCEDCHDAVTRRVEFHCRALLARLTDAEDAYMIDKGGEGYAERAYGIRYER